jgi:hypothetical protein
MSVAGVRQGGGEHSRTSLIGHHAITNVVYQTTELIHILGAVQESCDPPTI